MKRLILGTEDTETLAPYKYPQFKTRTDKQHNNHWRPTEANMTEDIRDLRHHISLDESRMYTTQFSFLTWMDMNIPKPLALLLLISTAPEVSAWILKQGGEEQNHQDTYQLMMELLGLDQTELYNRHITRPTLNAKAAFAREATNGIVYFLTKTLTEGFEGITKKDIHTLLKSVWFYANCFEGMWFMGGFAPILSLCERGYMPGSAIQLLYIWRDENSHVEGWNEWLRLVQEETGVTLTQEDVEPIMARAIMLESNYAKAEFPSVVGYNPDIHDRWMKYLGKLRMKDSGFNPHIPCLEGARFPGWLSRWQTKREGNFFETRVTEYQVGAKLEW